jgi:hypothetical protein
LLWSDFVLASPQSRAPSVEVPMSRSIDVTAEAASDCYSISEFCQRHNISVSFYFKLRAQGRGPRLLRLGSRVLISREAAADWRRAHEAAASSNTDTTT